jgi:Flp pilus assembly protein TadG
VRRFLRNQRGQAAMELALVMTPLLLCVCGAVDFGFIFANREAVTNSARDGARYASTHPSAWSNVTSPALNTIEGQIRNDSGTASIPNDDSHIAITYLFSNAGGTTTTCGTYSASSNAFVGQNGYTQGTCLVPGTLIQVAVTYQYHVITPIIRQIFNSVSMTSTSTMVEEQ